MSFSRRNMVIVAVAATWLVLLVLTFILVKSARQNQGGAGNQLQDSTQKRRTATDVDRSNLLMNREELEAAKRDYSAKTGKTNTVINEAPKIMFQLDPALKKNSETTDKNNKVLAATTTCNIDAAPQSVYVYDLKTHWSSIDAGNVAKEYGVNSPAYSLPTDTGTFQYQFTSQDNGTFFTLYEASGKYRYHLANPSAVTTPLDQGGQRDNANAFVTDHRLNNMITPATVESYGVSSLFTYKRILDTFTLTDMSGVESIAGGSVCDVPESTDMGTISVEIHGDGSVINLFNNTRTILGSYKANRLSLENSIAEYANAQPVDPIVLPPTATANVTTATVQSAVLAYFDLGPNYGQTLYVPMYIVRAVSGNAQVIGFFPAVSANELLQKGLVKQVAEPGQATSQQQGTLGFATPTPFAPPPPPASGPIAGDGVPGGQTSLPGTSGGGLTGCPGGLIDYTVRCSRGGLPVCSGMVSTKSSTDPYNICSSGCKNLSGTVTYQSGTSPCKQFINQENIPPAEIPYRGNDSFPPSMINSGEQITCSINACPC